MTDGQIEVIEKKDGSYVVSGASISSLNGLNDSGEDMKQQINEIQQKVDIMTNGYTQYLASKQYLDGFILFGVFVLVGLMIGRLLDGLFKQ